MRMDHTSKPNPTIDDVALRANVSTATVSRFLNDPERVRKATGLRVKQAVEELGYAPHFGGRALAMNSTNTIGAVVPTIENAIFARGIQAMQERLTGDDVTLLIASSNYDKKQEWQQIQALVARGIDGLLLIGKDRDPSVYTFLKNRGLPYVLAWVWNDDREHIYVGFPNEASSEELTNRVLELGHTSIGMIAGVMVDNDRARARVAGVRAALATAGLSLAKNQLIESVYDMRSGANAFKTLMAQSPRPTAIICGNDVLAAGAQMGARELGLIVPEDVSVVGFDDIDLASGISPPLTTVHVPHRLMGRSAAELLLDMRAGKSVSSQRIDTAIIMRSSLAPLSD